MRIRTLLTVLALPVVATTISGAAFFACGSDDSNGNGPGDGSITIDVVIIHEDGGSKDASSGGDACASESYGESCEASTDCACSGVCSATKCVPPPQCGDAILTWEGPTSNVDGTCIDNLAGFTLNWWQDDGGSPSDNELDAGLPCAAGPSLPCGDAGGTAVQLLCGYRLSGLGNGTWDFTASAYNDAGDQSSPSVEAQKTITCHDGG